MPATPAPSEAPPVPYVHFDVNHILSTGQSNAVALDGIPILSTTQPYANLMFDTGVIPATGCDGERVQRLPEAHELRSARRGRHLLQADRDDVGGPGERGVEARDGAVRLPHRRRRSRRPRQPPRPERQQLLVPAQGRLRLVARQRLREGVRRRHDGGRRRRWQSRRPRENPTSCARSPPSTASTITTPPRPDTRSSRCQAPTAYRSSTTTAKASRSGSATTRQGVKAITGQTIPVPLARLAVLALERRPDDR